MRIILLAAAAMLAGCATSSDNNFGMMASGLRGSALNRAMQSAAAFPLGSKENPVRASAPAGQRSYLSRLRCSDGTAPTFEREGNVGEGPYGGIMDVYAVKCATGTPASAAVYMDMYHDHVESAAVPGFTIAAP